MQFNGRAKDYLATDGEVPNRDAGKLPVTSVKNGSNSDVASHRADGLFFRWIYVEVCRRFTGRMTATPELRP